MENGDIIKNGHFLRSLDDRHGTSPEALGPADNVVETRAKKLQQACVIINGKNGKLSSESTTSTAIYRSILYIFMK